MGLQQNVQYRHQHQTQQPLYFSNFTYPECSFQTIQQPSCTRLCYSCNVIWSYKTLNQKLPNCLLQGSFLYKLCYTHRIEWYANVERNGKIFYELICSNLQKILKISPQKKQYEKTAYVYVIFQSEIKRNKKACLCTFIFTNRYTKKALRSVICKGLRGMKQQEYKSECAFLHNFQFQNLCSSEMSMSQKTVKSYRNIPEMTTKHNILS